MLIAEPIIAEKGLIDLLLEALQALPGVKATLCQEVEGDKTGGAHRIDLWIGGKSCPLMISATKTLYPRDVRQKLWQIHSHEMELSGKEVLHVLVAEAISPGAKDMLKSEHVGYFDKGGSLYLPAEGAYIYIDRPAPKPLLKSVRSLFSGRSEQVIHALLVRHEEWFGIKKLAVLAEVSPATVFQVLSELERLDWLESRGRGPGKERHVSKPSDLLGAWVMHVALNRMTPLQHQYYVPVMKAENLLGQICKAFAARNVEYAISSDTAAQQYAPYLSSISQVHCRALPNHAVEEALGDLGARSVNEGANIVITEAKSLGDFLFREKIGDIWLDSPIRTYVDLQRREGRAKELAEHLRKERIGF